MGLLRVEDLDLRTLRLMVNWLKDSHSGAHPLQPDEAKAIRAWLAARVPAAAFASAVSEQPRRPDRAAHAGLADEEVRRDR